MEKAQMQKVASSTFDRYKDKDKVYVTSDGQAFFDEVHATNHAAKNRTGKELGLETFRRDELCGSKGASKSADDLIAEIAATDILSVAQAILDAENTGKKRKTVIEACEKRITELKAL